VPKLQQYSPPFEAAPLIKPPALRGCLTGWPCPFFLLRPNQPVTLFHKLSTVLTSHGVGETAPTVVPSRLSKRAARRIIQRAFVLAGRDRNVRQHIREAEVTALWIIEDWHLAWTLLVRRGRVEFDRHLTRKPDLTLTWRTAEDFFRESEADQHGQNRSTVTGNLALRSFTEPICQAFWVSLRELLKNPVNGNGDPLV
jgi:hypothetical protein